MYALSSVENFSLEKSNRRSTTSKFPFKARRSRGVILSFHGWDKFQAAKTQAEFDENYGNRFTLEDLSDRTRLALNTITKVLKRTESVDKQSLQYAFQAFGLELSESDYTHPTSLFEALQTRQDNPQQDWGEAADVSQFYGREEELFQLRQWSIADHCRLVALQGIGGIGKSTLAVKLALQIQTEFEIVVWRSLRNAPPLEELLESILSFVLRIRGENPVIPNSIDGRLSMLMECLRSSRCLLILDNAETILSSGERAGQCRDGYEEYSQLLQTVGEVPHQSCLLLTTREKPSAIALLEGEKSKVRSLSLKGLKAEAGRELFQQKGQFAGSEAEWSQLSKHYGGNPLVLKLVAAAAQELFNGTIAEVFKYAQEGVLAFEQIRDLLEGQFNRLSALEQEVMYLMAVSQEPVSFAQLEKDIVTVASRRKLLEAMNSLLIRSLIEKDGEYFWVQPVVMEYVTERFVEQNCSEIETQQIEHFRSHTLVKAQAKDYVRELQEIQLWRASA
ncbi:NB-ARC domain-containing protein [Coleofasciculus sp. FACHB-129]|uniref:NB-ARC domain-containing protein n=1 Tax=Cyanophyceae TaxID=3028117 RepID=UPI0016836D54|nr:NB-ARC domain-containing protein [Coleofasciculus sp. FACHB-129]MBD1895854.1 NACHT domain-containing protein [Coleofasciculus sp. FACHB-129]